MSSNLAAQKTVVESLRIECSVNRMRMSQTIKELIQYTEQHKQHDPLINGIDKKVNPFIEKSSCTVV